MPAYSAVNPRTMQNILAAGTAGYGGADPKEVAWLMKVVLQSKRNHPFADQMGGVASGRPFIEVVDTRKVKGDQVVVTVRARLGGRGRQGDVELVGHEEKQKSTTYRMTVGPMWHGVGMSEVTAAQTVIGSKQDVGAREDLTDWWGWKQGTDILAEFFARAQPYNYYRPHGKSRHQLTHTDQFGLADISAIKFKLLSLNTTALRISKDAIKKELRKRYIINGCQSLFANLNSDPQWMEILKDAASRGDGNHLFMGTKPMFNDMIMNEWQLEGTDADATQGSFCAPMGITGVAIPAAPAVGFELKGGGTAPGAADKTDVDYFEGFPGIGYVGCEGPKIANDTTGEHYIAVVSQSGPTAGKIRLFAYQPSASYGGNKLVLTRALASATSGGTINQTTLATSGTDGQTTWNTGDWTTDYLTQAEIPAGALVFPINKLGAALCWGIAYGTNAQLTGYGAWNNGQPFGRRTTENQNHGRWKAIGYEAIWGCRATEDANNRVNGFVLIESVWRPDGFPQIDPSDNA